MAACFLNNLQNIQPPTRTLFYLTDFQSVVWPMEPRENCILCSSLKNKDK